MVTISTDTRHRLAWTLCWRKVLEDQSRQKIFNFGSGRPQRQKVSTTIKSLSPLPRWYIESKNLPVTVPEDCNNLLPIYWLNSNPLLVLSSAVSEKICCISFPSLPRSPVRISPFDFCTFPFDRKGPNFPNGWTNFKNLRSVWRSHTFDARPPDYFNSEIKSVVAVRFQGNRV